MNEATSFRQKLINLILRIYRSDAMLPLLIFIGVWIALGVVRLGFEIILTDTDFFMGHISRLPLSHFWRDFVPAWYRPLENMFTYLELTTFGKNFTPMILLQAIVPATTAVLIYFLVMSLTKQKRLIALTASIVYAFSLAEIEVTWLFVHKSVVADLLVLCAVLGYIRYQDTGKKPWLALMCFGAITAPWIREIAGSINAVLLMAALLEWWKDKKRDVWLIVILFVLAFHAVYPSFFVQLLFFRQVILLSIFERTGWGLEAPLGSYFSPFVPFKVVLYFSVLATIAALLSILAFFGSKRGRSGLLGMALFISVLPLVLIGIFYPEQTMATDLMAIPFAIAFGIVSFRFSKLLPIWFVVPMAPFFLLPVHDAWLRLAALPYIIMALLWIDELPTHLQNALARFQIARQPNIKPLVQILFITLMLIAANNIIISRMTFHDTIANNKAAAQWLVENTPGGSAVVSSIRLLPEVEYYSNDWIDAYYIRLPLTFPMPGGHSPPIGHPDILALSHNEEGVYLMIGDKNSTMGFPDNLLVGELELVQRFVVEAKYPMLDPFQMWIPKHYRRFGGPTDTLHEFDLIHTPFMGEARTAFTFYKLVREPVLIQPDYRGFSITQWGNMYFGIRQNEPGFVPVDMLGGEHSIIGFGYSAEDCRQNIDEILDKIKELPPEDPVKIDSYQTFAITFYKEHFYTTLEEEGLFDYERFLAKHYTIRFNCSSPEVLKMHLDNYLLRGGLPHDYHPNVVDEDYKGFSIVEYRGWAYGIPREEAPFDYQQFANDGYTTSIGPMRSRYYIQDVIDGAYQPQVHLIEEGYRGFNIILCGKIFYAIPQGEGEFDLKKFQDNGYSISFSGESFNEMQLFITEHTLANTTSIEIYNDDDETVWATEPGATINEETTIVKEGESSLKVVWDNSQAAVYYNFPDKQDWSDSKYVGLYVYGANSGAPMAMQVRFRGYGGGDWVDYRWIDDFSGWKAMVFELEKPSQSSGDTDWADVQQVLFRPLAKQSITLYFDFLSIYTNQ